MENEETLKEAIKQAFKKSEDSIKTTLDGNKIVIEGLQADNEEIKKSLKSLSDSVSEHQSKTVEKISYEQQRENAAKELFEEAKKAIKNKSNLGNFNHAVKAAATVMTRADVVAATAPFVLAFESMPFLATDFVNFVTNRALPAGTNELVFPYESAINGGAATQSEGTEKSQISGVIDKKSYSPDVIAAWGTLTNQTIEMMPDVRSYLSEKIDIAVRGELDAKLYKGTGIGQLAGLTSFAPAYVNARLNASIATPTIFDAINALIDSILNNSKGNYIPTHLFVNSSDLVKMSLAKTNTGEYIYPYFTIVNSIQQSYNLQIVKSERVTAGEFLIGDMARYYLYTKTPYTYSAGWIDKDFIKNQTTFRGELSVVGAMYDTSKSAFVADTWTNVINAIKTV